MPIFLDGQPLSLEKFRAYAEWSLFRRVTFRARSEGEKKKKLKIFVRKHRDLISKLTGDDNAHEITENIWKARAIAWNHFINDHIHGILSQWMESPFIEELGCAISEAIQDVAKKAGTRFMQDSNP